MNIELTDEDLATLDRALTDAIDYREGELDDDGADPTGCRDCKAGAPCEDHAGDQALARQYARLADKITGAAT